MSLFKQVYVSIFDYIQYSGSGQAKGLTPLPPIFSAHVTTFLELEASLIINVVIHNVYVKVLIFRIEI